MSTAPTVSSQPSIWRLGMVDWRFAFGVYASVIVGQFVINSTVSAIMYATSDDFSQHVDQAAVNAAFSTGPSTSSSRRSSPRRRTCGQRL